MRFGAGLRNIGQKQKIKFIGYLTVVTLPDSGERTGYTLKDFTLSGALSDTMSPGDSFTMPAGAVTVTANRHKDSGITITLDGDPKDETVVHSS